MEDDNTNAYRRFLDTPLPAGPAPLIYENPQAPVDLETGSALYENLQITLDQSSVGVPLTFDIK